MRHSAATLLFCSVALLVAALLLVAVLGTATAAEALALLHCMPPLSCALLLCMPALLLGTVLHPQRTAASELAASAALPLLLAAATRLLLAAATRLLLAPLQPPSRATMSR